MAQKAGTSPLLRHAGMPSEGLAYWIWRRRMDGPGLVVCPSPERAREVFQGLRAWPGLEPLLFGGSVHALYEEQSPSLEEAALRNAVRQRIVSGEALQNVWVVGCIQSFLRRWMPGDVFVQASCVLRTGQEYERKALVQQLLEMGFQPAYVCEDPGTFCVRGGVVDLWPVGFQHFIRLDFFGDELTQMLQTDPLHPSARRMLQEVKLYPLRDVYYGDGAQALAQQHLRAYLETATVPTSKSRMLEHHIAQKTGFLGIESLWPWFYTHTEPVLSTLLPLMRTVVLDHEETLWKTGRSYLEDVAQAREHAQQRLWPCVPVENHVVEIAWAEEQLKNKATLCTEEVFVKNTDQVTPHPLQDCRPFVEAMRAAVVGNSKENPMDVLHKHLQENAALDVCTLIVSENHVRSNRIKWMLEERGYSVQFSDTIPGWHILTSKHRADVYVCMAHLSHAFKDTEALCDVWVESEWQVERDRAGKKAAKKRAVLPSFEKGDHVVHPAHGIGLYDGLQRLVLHGVDGDYALVWYANNDKLYLPVYRIAELQPYVSAQKNVVLDTLGSGAWERHTQKVKDHVLHMAHELITVQAQRRLRKGVVVAPLGDTFEACVRSFPYETTSDQQQAIEDVLSDLQSGTVMDRLVCGDVGFGKTEVAVRAAYAMVLSGYQVAVLVPTTLLAEQHMLTFKERLEPLGVQVGVLSRMQKAVDVHGVLHGLKEGVVDVVVGTHRLLSPDVHMKNLGLLVIDEEQRFGVRHKEQLKKLRADVHVLNMSATPIPRTLYLATSGLRDMSLIQTPPEGRLDIHTEVLSLDEDVIKEAVSHEMRRGGQVYVVFHRVEEMLEWEKVFKEWFPEASVASAHGQMPAQALERVMMAFIHKKHDVLLCTSIIENGIDIPSANTMLVMRADMFGLSQLHQLRGRIGRGRTRGYAYLLVDGDNAHPVALKRLGLLKKWTGLGSGIHIATHDLDLRGAGHILGKNQSGHVASVGFELYTQMLEEAVEKIRGNPSSVCVEPDVFLPVPAVLPESYIPDASERLHLYQEFAHASSDDEVLELCDRIEQVYGSAPVEVSYMVSAMAVRRQLKKIGASWLEVKEHADHMTVSLVFTQYAHVDREEIVSLCVKNPTRYRMSSSGKWVMSVPWHAKRGMPALLAEVQALLETVPMLK